VGALGGLFYLRLLGRSVDGIGGGGGGGGLAQPRLLIPVILVLVFNRCVLGGCGGPGFLVGATLSATRKGIGTAPAAVAAQPVPIACVPSACRPRRRSPAPSNASPRPQHPFRRRARAGGGAARRYLMRASCSAGPAPQPRWNQVYAANAGLTLQLIPMLLGFFTYKLAVIGRQGLAVGG
jgi:hypothetical protein